MDRRRRKDILGQWGVRSADPREEAKARALHADVAGGGRTGRPLELRRRHFRPSVDSYVTSLGGPLPYMVRLREIERLQREAEAELAGRQAELAADCAGNPVEFSRRWRELARTHRFDEINDLIERHNRCYPIEARLAMDVRRRDHVLVNGRPYGHEPLGEAWVLARFPEAIGH